MHNSESWKQYRDLSVYQQMKPLYDMMGLKTRFTKNGKTIFMTKKVDNPKK